MDVHGVFHFSWYLVCRFCLEYGVHSAESSLPLFAYFCPWFSSMLSIFPWPLSQNNRCGRQWLFYYMCPMIHGHIFYHSAKNCEKNWNSYEYTGWNASPFPYFLFISMADVDVLADSRDFSLKTRDTEDNSCIMCVLMIDGDIVYHSAKNCEKNWNS